MPNDKPWLRAIVVNRPGYRKKIIQAGVDALEEFRKETTDTGGIIVATESQQHPEGKKPTKQERA